MKRILTATAALAFLAAPALAQSTDGGATSGGATMAPETNATGTMGSGQDNMGAAARTGDVTAPSGSMGSMGTMGTDNMSTSSTDAPRDGTTIPTQGMDPAGAAAASETTPSGGVVPGQSSN